MIDYVKGKIVELEPNYIVIDTGNWGVKLAISLYTFNVLKTRLKSEAKIYTHIILKDDAIELAGFSDPVERQAFLLLNKVPGIGPKVALSILSTLDVSKLKASILAEDIKVLVTVPGIGKKTAQKIIIDLKDKIKDLPVKISNFDLDIIYEALEVLISLGFSHMEAQNAIDECVKDINLDDCGVEQLVMGALKILSK